MNYDSVYGPIFHCSVEFKGRRKVDNQFRTYACICSVTEDGLFYKASGDGIWRLIENAPQELKVAAACLCAGLMPPSYFADLLEDHRPDLSEVAAFLREWERLKGEQK